MSDRLLTTKQVAERVGDVSESTVRYWRMTGYGPAGFRVGRRVLYPQTEVETWLRELRAAEGGVRSRQCPGQPDPSRAT